MALTPFHRAVEASRRFRRPPEPAPPVTKPPVPARRRAGMGIEVSPVHGRHCICNRCAADRPSA